MSKRAKKAPAVRPVAKRRRPEKSSHDEATLAAEKAYLESLIATGEASRLTPGGKLPAGATHEIVSDDEEGTKVERRRFSIF